MKLLSYSNRVQSMNLHIKSVEWFFFKSQIEGKWVKYYYHEVHGFSNSFKQLENPAKLLAKCIFAYNSRTRFCKHKLFGRITKAAMVHHLTPTKAYIDGSIFFQNPYCWFIPEHLHPSMTKPSNPFQRF